MAVTASAVNVGTSATLLSASGSDNGTQSFAVYNNGASSVYLGGPDVTVAAGLPVAAGVAITLDLANVQDEMYAICASGSVEVRVLRAH